MIRNVAGVADIRREQHDTPYREEAVRVGDHLLPRLRPPVTV